MFLLGERFSDVEGADDCLGQGNDLVAVATLRHHGGQAEQVMFGDYLVLHVQTSVVKGLLLTLYLTHPANLYS